MTGRAGFRGQPLLLFGGVLLGWVALRVAMWEPPFARERTYPPPAAPLAARAGAVNSSVARTGLPRDPVAAARMRESTAPDTTAPWPVPPPSWTIPADAPSPLPAPVPPEISPPLMSPRAAIGHSVMLALGLSRMQLPAALAGYLRDTPSPGAGPPGPSLAASSPDRTRTFVSRWSADGWLLLRREGTPDIPGPILSDRPGYGRSQAGAVIRYSLVPGSASRPRAYVRVAAALAGPRDREVAAGLSFRPLPEVPLRVAAEGRASESAAGRRARPAAYAVTEFPPLDLPLDMRAEAYVQAGYVGGGFATAFVDGQARVERRVARVRDAEIAAGAGAWGGAQRDSARLDIGPTATATFRLGEARGRVAADYRFRVAGDAEPASGPALTVSAGF